MKPAPFRYLRAVSVEHAVQALCEAEGDARVIAGGQTLGPMLNLRLAIPSLLIDLNRIAGLKRIEKKSGRRLIGACVTHSALEDGEDGSKLSALLASIASSIAFRSVRNRGTIGGSLAHADPAADWVTLMSILDANVVLAGPQGRRTLRFDDFVIGTFTTALIHGEILETIELMELSATVRWGFYKISQKIGEFPKAIGAVLLDEQTVRAFVGGLNRKPVMISGLAETVRHAVDGACDLKAIADHVKEAAPELDEIDLQIYATTLQRAIRRAVVQ